MEIDQRRLRQDIESNAEFGAFETDQGRGRTVLTGSDADKRARDYFVERIRDAGLSVDVDAVGNVAGRWVPDGADPDLAAVAAGSHLDSVPRGGIFDGPLGVYAALEAVRAIQESDIEPTRPIEIVSFTEEEGARCSVGLLGSSVAAGVRSPEEALALTDDDGTTLERHLANVGYNGSGRLDAGGWDAWLEVHIEQGTTLKDSGTTIGVVDAITGITNCRVEIAGEADHAGATPMYDRTDALVAASEFVLDVERAGWDVVNNQSETAVATVGEFDIGPGARNIVPGRVSLSMDVRDVDYDAVNEIVSQSRASLARLEHQRGVETSLDRYRDQRPSQMHDRCVEAVKGAARASNTDCLDMYSAAMHDTANVADVTDSVLVFVPSEDGISHNPREFTSWSDCTAGTRVLAGALAQLAT